MRIALRPEAFQACFREWIAHAARTEDGEPARLVAIGGQAGRGSHRAAHGLGPLHIVSAWATEEGLALGQAATEEESDEITAIPQLVRQLELRNTIITVGAMGCQKEVARGIVGGWGIRRGN